jgi:hypothetical protein
VTGQKNGECPQVQMPLLGDVARLYNMGDGEVACLWGLWAQLGSSCAGHDASCWEPSEAHHVP